MPNTIRWRLIASSLLAIGIPLLLFAVVLTTLLWRFYLGQLEQELQTKALVIADAVQPILSPSSPDDDLRLATIVGRWRRYSRMRVTVVDGRGTIRAATVQEDVGSRFNEERRPGLSRALSGEINATVWKNPRYGFEDTMYANLPVFEGASVIGAVRVAYTLTEIQSNVRRIQGTVAAGFGIYAALVVVFTLALARTIARPLEQLQESAQVLASGDLSHRVTVRGGLEVTELGATLNRMAERLQHLEGMRRQYVANVSHELRTPLAVLRGMIETLLQYGKGDPALLDRYLPRMLGQTDRLARLAAQFLDLAQIESGNLLGELEPVRLREVAEEVLQTCHPRASARGVTLRIESAEELPPVQADRDRLVQVLLNLVDNAVRHTPEGGSVTVCLGAGPDRVSIQVRDTGEGIPEEHLPRLFERFYRVDASRSRKSGGTGLGLSIVRQIVEAHGGSIGVESRPGVGTTFRVDLPQSARS